LRRGLSLGLVALAVLVVATNAASAERSKQALLRTQEIAGPVVAGEVLVQFRPHVSRADKSRVLAAQRSRVVGRSAFGIMIVKLPRDLSIASALKKFRADPAVAVAEPNQILRERFTPNDTFFSSEQWALENDGLTQHHFGDSTGGDAVTQRAGTADADVDAAAAWDVNQGDANTVIAVIDVGVEIDHPDLQANIWTNLDELANGLDDDGNGKVDDLNGWDFVDNEADPSPNDPQDDHGTFVAGVAAAVTNNATGVAGMCPQCKIMGLRVHTLAEWIQALAYAKDEGADVVNMSIGGYNYSRLERNAIAAGANSFLLVVAADNWSLDNDLPLEIRDSNGNALAYSPAYPGVYTLPNILHVAASNDQDEYGYATGCALNGGNKRDCAITNWGHDSVDVAAPGVDITGTLLGGGYQIRDGTSFAAPLAAGVAGLVKSRHPTYTPLQVRNMIMNSVDKPLALTKMYSPTLGAFSGVTGAFTRTSGRVNAAAALDGSTANATPRTDGNIDGAKVMPTSRVTGTVSYPADVNDVWAKKLYKGRRYRLTMNGKDGQDFDLFVWKPGTNEIFQNLATGTGSKLQAWKYTTTFGNVETYTFRARATGKFYFQVEAWLRRSGRYALRVARL
jgi:subtilisin family serine protease